MKSHSMPAGKNGLTTFYIVVPLRWILGR